MTKAETKLYNKKYHEAHKDRARELRQKNKVSRQIYMTRYRLENKDDLVKWRKAYRQRPSVENKNRLRMREYYRRNSEALKIQARVRRVLNREKILERERLYRKANPLIYKMQRLRHREKNREALNISKRAYKARKRSADGKFGVNDIRHLLAIQNGRCYWCCVSFGAKFHIDHEIPISRGGTNWPSNLRLACPICNVVKHDSMPMDFVLNLLQQ